MTEMFPFFSAGNQIRSKGESGFEKKRSGGKIFIYKIVFAGGDNILHPAHFSALEPYFYTVRMNG